MVHKLWLWNIEILGSLVVECHTLNVQFCRISRMPDQAIFLWSSGSPYNVLEASRMSYKLIEGCVRERERERGVLEGYRTF